MCAFKEKSGCREENPELVHGKHGITLKRIFCRGSPPRRIAETVEQLAGMMKMDSLGRRMFAERHYRIIMAEQLETGERRSGEIGNNDSAIIVLSNE